MKVALAVLFLTALLAVGVVGTAAARDGGNGSSAAQRNSGSDDGQREHDGRNEAEHGQVEHEAEHNGRSEAGEDVRGNCDEAEHRADAGCPTAASASLTSTFASAAAVSSGTTSGRRLIAKVGSGYTISLRTTAGAIPRTLRPGAYTIVVRDLSDEHDFHFRGRGIDKSTSVAGTGTSMWRVTLTRGAYRFACDPHASMMSGTLRVA